MQFKSLLPDKGVSLDLFNAAVPQYNITDKYVYVN